MRKDSSVSRFAERELRFVDPNSVRMGGDVAVGESQIPAIMNVEISGLVTMGVYAEMKDKNANLWRDTSSLLYATQSARLLCPRLALQYPIQQHPSRLPYLIVDVTKMGPRNGQMLERPS